MIMANSSTKKNKEPVKTVKVYLKSQRKPMLFDVSNTSIIDDFYSNLMTHDVIKFGPVIFRREEFLYAVIE